jgi:alcohol dehydrogenase class IV
MPLPRRLGDVPGLDRTRIPHYAGKAMIDHCRQTNPRPCRQPDLEDLLERAW